jgi:hypothetical protein
MTIGRGLAAAVVFAGVALGSASPASASDIMMGTYTYTQPGVLPATWEISPTCVRAGCDLHVTGSTPHHGPDSDSPPYGGVAWLVNDRWTMVVNTLDGTACPDGSRAASTNTYAFDDVTLTGTVTLSHPEVCGLQPAITRAPFNLTFVAPPLYPIDAYPQICDPWARCF